MFQRKIVEKNKTYVMFNNFLFANCVVYKIMWKNMVQPYRSQCMHFACHVTKATHKCSEYVILIALPQQQWFCKHNSIIFCLYLQFLPCFSSISAICSAYLILLHLITWIIFIDTSHCAAFNSLLYLPLIGPNIFLCTQLLNTFRMCSSHNVRGQVSHPYKMS